MTLKYGFQKVRQMVRQNVRQKVRPKVRHNARQKVRQKARGMSAGVPCVAEKEVQRGTKVGLSQSRVGIKILFPFISRPLCGVGFLKEGDWGMFGGMLGCSQAAAVRAE